MRPVSITLALICALLSAGCATERLGATAPGGVDLSGEWNFDANLSDDPDKPGAPDNTPQRTPGRHRGHGGGRGGMPPMGSPNGGAYNYLPVAATRNQKAPAHLSITQKDASVVVRTNMPDGTQTVEEYIAGTHTRIQYGEGSTADRSVGWRGPVFVITTTPKKGGAREVDFALDEYGHLIVTTLTKVGGGREVKRVYDRVRGVQS